MLLISPNELLEFCEDVAVVVVANVSYQEYEICRDHYTISILTKMNLVALVTNASTNASRSFYIITVLLIFVLLLAIKVFMSNIRGLFLDM